MLTKIMPATIKAVEDDAGDAGQFEAIVSVFGNVDLYGDRVMPGAFTDTLAEWAAKGDPIPVLWSHNSYDPAAHIGVVEQAEERKEGLWVRGRLDIDADPVASKAPQVWRLMKGRRVTQFSFMYDVVEGAEVRTDGQYAYELRKLKLYEVGPCLLGVNPATELLDTKALRALAHQVKAGRVLSAKNEGLLREAHTSIGEVLSALDDDGKAKPAPANDEGPGGVKSEEPNPSPATLRLRSELDLLELTT